MQNKKLLFIILFYCLNVFGDIITPSFDLKFVVNSDGSLDAENNQKGEIVNSTSFARGDMKSVEFSGLCDYINMPTENSGAYVYLNQNTINTQAITIVFWAKIDSLQAQRGIGTFIDIVSSQEKSILKITTKNITNIQNGFSLESLLSDGNSYDIITDSRKAFEYSIWTQFAISYIPGEMVSFYINGKPYERYMLQSSVDGLFSDSFKIYIGKNHLDTDGLLGSVDEVKIFPNILSDAEIFTIYSNENNYKNIDGTQRVCVEKNCRLISKIGTNPLSDIFNNIVFTKNVFTYDCVSVYQKRGSCVSESVDYSYVLPEANNTNAYINTFAGGNLQEIANMVSAQSFANKIMSGWKGYCEKGLKSDFSWASDPYYWASLAISTAAGYIGGSAATSTTTATEGAKSVATSTVTDAATSTATNAATNAATDVATETVTKTVKDEATKALTKAVEDDLFDKLASYSICLAQAGLDVAGMGEDDEIPCDPIDEICDDEETSASSDSQVYTLSETDYNDMLIENPEFSENILVLDVSDGQIKFKIIYSPMDSNLDSEEMNDAIAAQQEKMKRIQETYIGVYTSLCLYDAYGGSSPSTSGATSSSGSDSGLSGSDLVGAALNMAATAVCGPLCGAAVSVIMSIGTSYEKINTCSDRGDAVEAGTRHQATYDANKLGLCKFVKSKCIESSLVGSGCQLNSYYYCCYDTVLTKIIAEQAKAQFAMDWEHCTGFSLNEFMHINYSSCQNTDGVDGTKLPYDANSTTRKEAFQYQEKCIDYTEYIQYITKFTDGQFSEEDMKSLIDTDYSATSSCDN